MRFKLVHFLKFFCRVSEGHLLVVKAVLQTKPTAISYLDRNGTNLLMIAVESISAALQKGNGVEIIKLMIKNGIDVRFHFYLSL